MIVIQPITLIDGGSISRASSKTCIGNNGLLQTVAANTLAWAFDPANLAAAPMLLLESAATNALLNSARPDLWSLTRATFAPGTGTGPDGTASARKMIEDASITATHTVSQFVAKTGAAPWSFTIFAKAAERSQILLQLDSTLQNSLAGVIFDLAAGTAGQPTTSGEFFGATAQIKPLASGWYACSLSAVCDADTRLYARLSLCIGSNPAYTGDGVSGAWVFAGQLEQGAPSSYIPTTTAPAARAEDMVTGTAPSVLFAPPENEFPIWSSTRPYNVGDTVIKNHRKWQCLVANQGSNPATSTASPPNWKDIGTTLRWAAFDGVNGTLLTGASVNLVFMPGLIDSIDLFNISGDWLTVCVYDGYTLLYRKTVALANRDDVMSEWDADFAPYTLITNLALLDLPPCTNAVVSLSISATTPCALGNLIAGSAYDAGDLEYGVALDMVSATKLIDDGFGNLTAKKGQTRLNLKGSLSFKKNMFDRNLRILRAVDGIPTAWIGTATDADLQSLNLFGVLGSYSPTVTEPKDCKADIDIKGYV